MKELQEAEGEAGALLPVPRAGGGAVVALRGAHRPQADRALRQLECYGTQKENKAIRFCTFDEAPEHATQIPRHRWCITLCVVLPFSWFDDGESPF